MLNVTIIIEFSLNAVCGMVAMWTLRDSLMYKVTEKIVKVVGELTGGQVSMFTMKVCTFAYQSAFGYRPISLQYFCHVF